MLTYQQHMLRFCILGFLVVLASDDFHISHRDVSQKIEINIRWDNAISSHNAMIWKDDMFKKV